MAVSCIIVEKSCKRNDLCAFLRQRSKTNEITSLFLGAQINTVHPRQMSSDQRCGSSRKVKQRHNTVEEQVDTQHSELIRPVM
jgi:hypothetical protein